MTGYGKTGTTIKDVANEVGLSITAVSQVLNGKDCRISQEKRILIQQKAKELNYQPNRNAVALVTNCTKIIGVILNDISNIYFAEFAKGAEDIASENGYQLLLVNMQNRWNKPKSFANLLGYDTTDGLIITRDLDTPELKKYIDTYYYERKKPVANAGNGEFIFPSGNIIFDNEQGGYIATKHLLELGHRRIGCITGSEYTPLSRLRGYKKALLEFGIEYDETLVKVGDYHEELATKHAKDLYEQGVTAIFAFNDLMAFGVYRMAEQNNLCIGKDLSVVGFDDLEFSAFLSTPLTTIQQPAYKMGEASCKMLIDMIKNDTQTAEDVHFQPKLIVRKSTGYAACEKK